VSSSLKTFQATVCSYDTGRFDTQTPLRRYAKPWRWERFGGVISVTEMADIESSSRNLTSGSENRTKSLKGCSCSPNRSENVGARRHISADRRATSRGCAGKARSILYIKDVDVA
jgi:hypothetical protein